MDYKKLLEESYKADAEFFDHIKTRHSWLSENIFDFTLYDSAMEDLFGKKAVEVCKAISEKTTFDYIKIPDNYRWFLIMVNMLFFQGKIDWGGSIRGAWWEHCGGKPFKVLFTGLGTLDEPINGPLKFTEKTWLLFIQAVIDFASKKNLPQKTKV
jgi:hypothetical protein